MCGVMQERLHNVTAAPGKICRESLLSRSLVFLGKFRAGLNADIITLTLIMGSG